MVCLQDSWYIVIHHIFLIFCYNIFWGMRPPLSNLCCEVVYFVNILVLLYGFMRVKHIFIFLESLLLCEISYFVILDPNLSIRPLDSVLFIRPFVCPSVRLQHCFLRICSLFSSEMFWAETWSVFVSPWYKSEN